MGNTGRGVLSPGIKHMAGILEKAKNSIFSKKKHTFWPSWDSCFGALWVENDQDEAEGHIKNSGKCVFFLKYLTNLQNGSDKCSY